jgi:hemerythrin superfamily protein
MLSQNKSQEAPRARKAQASLDIVDLILEDHKPLKALIKILKDEDFDAKKREDAMEEFAVQLVSHADPEEDVLYNYMKQTSEMRSEAFEGIVEHGLADQMLEEIRRTNDPDLWSAKVKVVAELVEHHIKEEEEDLLPDFKKHSEREIRNKLGSQFLQAKTVMFEQGGENSPEEKELDVKH